MRRRKPAAHGSGNMAYPGVAIDLLIASSH
jgi:hypothetical protein